MKLRSKIKKMKNLILLEMLIMYPEIRILQKRKIQKTMILNLRREAMEVVTKRKVAMVVAIKRKVVMVMVPRKEVMVVMAVEEVVDEDEVSVDQEVVVHQKERAVTLVMITLLEVVIII